MEWGTPELFYNYLFIFYLALVFVCILLSANVVVRDVVVPTP